MEKAYKAWGGELTTEITPVEPDLMRFVDFSKSFIGREATGKKTPNPCTSAGLP